MRAFDWDASPLGRPERWPQALRSTTRLMLGSRFPMFVAWGAELNLLYNQAGAEIIGAKHPDALGRPLREVWSRIWDDISPHIACALSGDAAFGENVPLIIERFGYEEEAFFTFSFSPVLDEKGVVGGLFAVVTETTSRIVNDQRLGFLVELGDQLRRLTDPVDIGQCAARMLGEHLGIARAGYGEINEAQDIVVVPRDWNNGTVASLAGEARILDAFGPRVIEELRAGRTLLVEDCLKDERAGDAYAATWASIGTRALIVVPLLKEAGLRAIFYLHEPEPRRWSEREATLARDVAERTWDAVERARVEKALRESEARLRLAVDAGRMAIWEWDAQTNSVGKSPELNRLLGFPPEYDFTLDEAHARYYPGELEKVRTAGRSALEAGERFFEAEFCYGWPGPAKWLLLRGELIFDETGPPSKVLGILMDVTERERAREELRAREVELREALDAASMGTYAYNNVSGDFTSSPGLRRIYGYPESQVLTIKDIQARYHPDDWDKTLQMFRQAEQAVNPQFEMEFRLLLPDGSVRWVAGKGEYLRDSAGKTLSSRGVVMDVTARKKWEEHQQLLINELNHRVKNTLATVQSIASQTLRNSATAQETREAIESRLFALSRAHDVLTRENWEGAGLKEIVTEAMAPYRHDHEERLHAQGPDVRLSPRTALALAMALQELATNAVKYGALSNATGQIRIGWAIERQADGPRLRLIWTERCGPRVEPPSRRGFGTRLIERSLAQDLSGEVRIDFAPDGVICTVDAPLG